MNACRATYKQTCGGYQALLRLPRDGYLKPVLGKGGMPIIYNSPLAAQEAATERLCEWINGNLRRDGERLSAVKSEAEALFAKTKRRAVA